MPGSAKEILEAQILGPERRLNSLSVAEIGVAKVGQGWAIFFTFVSVTTAIFFFAAGNSIAGAAFLGVPLIGLIGSLLPRIGGKR